MIGFVFCHGWAYDPSFWDNLKSYFKNYPCIFWNLGYFAPSNLLIPKDLTIKWIGIGHSLGFIKLLTSPMRWHKLVGLQGFVNFQGNNSSLKRKRTRDLLKLQQHFERDAAGALAFFYKSCGGKRIHNNILRKEVLLNDLKQLQSVQSLINPPPCLILGTKDDLIVTNELINDNFEQCDQVQIMMHDKGSHNLGFSEPEFVYRAISNFVFDVQ